MGGGVLFFHPFLKNKMPPPSGKREEDKILSLASRALNGLSKVRDRPAQRTGTSPCGRKAPASDTKKVAVVRTGEKPTDPEIIRATE